MKIKMTTTIITLSLKILSNVTGQYLQCQTSISDMINIKWFKQNNSRVTKQLKNIPLIRFWKMLNCSLLAR